MGDRLRGRTAIVTGAATGIGRAIAQRFAREGAQVVVSGLDAEQCARAADDIAALTGSELAAIGGDLSLLGEAERLRDYTLSRFGKIDVLVNNAGGGVILPSLQHTEETLQRTIANNLWTTLRCTLAIIPVMVERGYGRIVNVGAESVRNGLDSHAVYNAAKGGVHAMMSGFAREFATTGVTFNTVAPSYVVADASAETAVSTKGPADRLASARARAVELIPMGRGATADEVAAAVLFLGSDEAGFITGQVLSVNGGSSMQ
jgi:2,3-dihydroxy-2,3-dihydro-p-cumate dehydrogenase